MIPALIVDDEPPARDQVREFLSGERDVLVVGESADGEDAVRQIERTRFREAVERARRYLARDASLMRHLEPNTLRAILTTLETVGASGRRHLRVLGTGK